MNARELLAIVAARSRRAPIVLALLAAAAGGAARGDWLVLASGDQIETKGSWILDGQKVIFTSTRGVLSSVRASSVDVASSRALTAKKHEEATAVVAATPVPKREPVLVLTDADFAKATAPASAGAVVLPGSEAEAGAAATEPVVVPAADSLETRIARQMPGPPAVRVTSWSARPTGEDQLSVFGTVDNVGSLVAAAITVTVTLIDSEGDELGSMEAAITATALMPGTQAELEARFEGNPNFATVEFAVTVVELEVSRPTDEDSLEEPVDEGATAAPPRTAPAAGPPRTARPAAPPPGAQGSGDEPHAGAAAASPRP